MNGESVRRRAVCLLSAAALTALFVACAGPPGAGPNPFAPQPAGPAVDSNVNRDNYGRVKNGMSLKEVQEILGPGKESASGPGVLIVTWQADAPAGRVPLVISVTFQNNRVVSKAIAP